MRVNIIDLIAIFGLLMFLVGVFFWLGWAATLALLGLVVFSAAIHIASRMPVNSGGG